MKSTLLLMVLLTTLGGGAPTTYATDDDLAATFYPPELAADVPEGHPNLTAVRQWKTVRVDFDGTGTKNYLVVAYSNGFRSQLRVIKDSAAGPTLLPVTGSATLFDSLAGLDTVDLDGDVRPEVVVQFHVGRSEIYWAWIYQWQRDHLACVNPTVSDDDASGETTLWHREIREPEFVDLDGDGRLEVLSPSDEYGVDEDALNAAVEADEPVDLVPDQTYDVYKLSSEGLEEADTSVAFLGYFTRRQGSPERKQAAFLASPGEYVVAIINGDHGRNLVDSGEILVNDKRIVGPSDFKEKVDRLTRAVSLREKNSISVELRSAPGSRITVAIQKAVPASPSRVQKTETER